MINYLKLKDFRNFKDREFFFDNDKNFIVGENGKGKTNILEAISLISGNNLTKISFENLVNKDSKLFYIEVGLDSGDKISISYDKEENKKRYSLNNKITTKSKVSNNGIKTVSFTPMIMNMLYLSPSLRRDFLDGVLKTSFEEYDSYLKKAKSILTNRNKVLKNIKEGKSEKTEIKFWDKKYIEISKVLYNYRFGIIDYIKENMDISKDYFFGKIDKIELDYKTKVKKESVEEDIRQYLEKNLDRDIILGTTQIGTHVDDFEILVDSIPLTEFASRGEAKSIILHLKILEIKFIEKYLGKKPILLIDDLLSELDDSHKNLLVDKLNNYQTFITSIKIENPESNNLLSLN